MVWKCKIKLAIIGIGNRSKLSKILNFSNVDLGLLHFGEIHNYRMHAFSLIVCVLYIDVSME